MKTNTIRSYLFIGIRADEEDNNTVILIIGIHFTCLSINPYTNNTIRGCLGCWCLLFHLDHNTKELCMAQSSYLSQEIIQCHIHILFTNSISTLYQHLKYRLSDTKEFSRQRVRHSVHLFAENLRKWIHSAKQEDWTHLGASFDQITTLNYWETTDHSFRGRHIKSEYRLNKKVGGNTEYALGVEKEIYTCFDKFRVQLCPFTTY